MASVIDRWCSKRGLATPGGAAQAIVVDNVRVSLAELPSGLLVIESKVMVLPLAERERDALVERAARLALGRLRFSRARLVADADASGLWLQVVLPGMASDEQISEAVEDLVNEVERWRKAV
jgi:hypothetical protein